MRFLAFFAVLATLAACNTVEGMGQDIQAGGKAIEKAANNMAN